MKNTLIILLFYSFFTLFDGFSQQERIEYLSQKCFYKKLGDKNRLYKKHLNEYEKELIRIGVLKDNSPRGYKNLLPVLNKTLDYRISPNYSLDSIAYVFKAKDLKRYNTSCVEKLKNHIGSKDFDEMKKTFEKDMRSFIENGEIGTLKSISIQDFELDYYKHLILYITDLWFSTSYDLRLKYKISQVKRHFNVIINQT